MATIRSNQRDAVSHIQNREDFLAASLAGHFPSSGLTGRLNAAEAAEFEQDFLSMSYVVMSYGTPIAWEWDGGWHVVEQKFSVTTSKHQSIVRRALAGL
jgi:hypothetical protein